MFPRHRLCMPPLAAAVAQAVCFVISITACRTPTRPTVSMAAAKAVAPADGSIISTASQPVTLTVQNAVTTQSSLPVSDGFDVATDSAFAHIVVTKVIPQSAGPQTSVTLDPLAPATYYWRVHASGGGVAVTSATSTFRIAAMLQAPVPVLPANGVLIGDLNQPVRLAVQNPTMPPTLMTPTDTFDVATDEGFASVVATTSVPQATGPQTAVTLPSPLPPRATYYWRVRVNAADVIGATSAAASFRIGPAIVSGPYKLIVSNPYRNVGLCGTRTGCLMAP